MIDLPCHTCGKPVTVSVRNAVARGVPMATIREGQDWVTDWALREGKGRVDLPPCREHSGLFS